MIFLLVAGYVALSAWTSSKVVGPIEEPEDYLFAGFTFLVFPIIGPMFALGWLVKKLGGVE